jgi:hypothetical protein
MDQFLFHGFRMNGYMYKKLTEMEYYNLLIQLFVQKIVIDALLKIIVMFVKMDSN